MQRNRKDECDNEEKDNRLDFFVGLSSCEAVVRVAQRVIYKLNKQCHQIEIFVIFDVKVLCNETWSLRWVCISRHGLVVAVVSFVLISSCTLNDFASLISNFNYL